MRKSEAGLKLLELKPTYYFFDKGFGDLLCVLKKLLISANESLGMTYKAKQMILPSRPQS
jgi:hypothetical protein